MGCIRDAKRNQRLTTTAAVTTRKAETYSPETYVIDLGELRQIIFELQAEEKGDG